MTDGGAATQTGAEETPSPYWPRSAYAGFRAFGSGDGAVLVTPDAVSSLHAAAELATSERRIAGGLLFGRGYTDGQGDYLVVDGFLEAGPRESGDHDLSPDEADDFTLSEDDVRAMRADATRRFPAARETGWWRTLPSLGDFGPGDYLTQQELVLPGGAGLLVYGSGAHWGTAYLGPDGHAPDSAGTLVVVPEDDDADDLDEADDLAGPPGPVPPAPESPGEVTRDDIPVIGPAPIGRNADGTVDSGSTPGTELARRRRAELARMPQSLPPVPTRPSWAAQTVSQGYATEAGMPRDVKVVVTLLLIAAVVAAVMIGMLVSSAMIALIVGVACVLVVLGFVWFTRL